MSRHGHLLQSDVTWVASQLRPCRCLPGSLLRWTGSALVLPGAGWRQWPGCLCDCSASGRALPDSRPGRWRSVRWTRPAPGAQPTLRVPHSAVLQRVDTAGGRDSAGLDTRGRAVKVPGEETVTGAHLGSITIAITRLVCSITIIIQMSL